MRRLAALNQVILLLTVVSVLASISGCAGTRAVVITPTSASEFHEVADLTASTADALLPQQTPDPTPARTATSPGQAKPAATPETPRRSPQQGIVFAYYVPYDPTSWASLQAHADAIDYLAPQWVTIDSCGNVGSSDDHTLIAFARSKGMRIVPSLLTSSEGLNHRLLTESATAKHAIQELVDYVAKEGYDGLDLDLESVAASDRQAYTDFVESLAKAMHQSGKLLTAAIPAKTYDATTGWGGAYQYSALAPYFDLITLMTYEYSSAAGKPGSIAPIEWVDKVLAYATSQIPRQKVLVGVAFYGRDWNVTSGELGKSLQFPQAAALSKRYDKTINIDPSTRSATFSYAQKPGDPPPPEEKLPPLQHDISVHKPAFCAANTPTPTPRPKPTAPPKPTPLPGAPQEHEVWLEDARSVGAKADLATKYNAAGVGTWRLGQEDPAVWPTLADWQQSAKK